MPSLTIPIMTSTSSLVFGPGLTKTFCSALSTLFGLGTGTTGMSSVGSFSSTPVIVNPLTQSAGSAITFQGLPWNVTQDPPLVLSFGTGPAHDTGSILGFNHVLGPQVQTGSVMSSAMSSSSTPFLLFSSGSIGVTPLVRSSARGQYNQT